MRTFKQSDAILKCANDIADYFEQTFGCSVPESDFQQIVFLIALSVERYSYNELTFDKLATLMDRQFVDTVMSIAQDMGHRYDIDLSDESFLLQLVLHMYNVYQRAVYHVSYPNPLAGQIKSEYAPVYDMAVYFSHRFATTFNIQVSENEIAFIAFHIGAYIDYLGSLVIARGLAGPDFVRDVHLMQTDTFDEFLEAFSQNSTQHRP